MIQFMSRYKRVEKLAYSADGGRLFGGGETVTTTRRDTGIEWWDPGGSDRAVGFVPCGVYGCDFGVSPDGRVIHGKGTPTNSYQKQLVSHDPAGGPAVALPVHFPLNSARMIVCPAANRLVVGCGWSVGLYHGFRLPLPAIPVAEWTCPMPSQRGYPTSVCAALEADASGDRFLALELAGRGRCLVAQQRATANGAAAGTPIPVPTSANHLRFAAGETRLIVAASASLYSHDLTNPKAKPVKVTTANRQHFTGIAVHPDGRRVLATCNDATVREYDSLTLQELRAYAWKIGRLRCVAIAPDGITAAAGSDTGKVIVWDLE